MPKKSIHQAIRSLSSNFNPRYQAWVQTEHQVIPNKVVTTAPMTVLSLMSYAAPSTTHTVHNRGVRCLPNNHILATGPALYRTASSYIGNSTQSHNEAREKFEQAKNEFPFAAKLLEISIMWGGDALPRMMYDRASSPRKGWNTQGEIEEVYLEDGMGFQGDETRDAIQYLKSENLLILDSNGDGDRYEKLSVDKSMQQYLKPQVRDLDLLKTRSLMLMCHLFPGSKEIEPFHHKDLGRLQLRPFQCVVEYIPELLEKKLLSARQQHEVIATLLESSNFSDRDWKLKALIIADSMLATTAPDEFLQAYAEIRRKAVNRQVLGRVCPEPYLPERLVTCPISNFLYWKLRLSKAQDCIHRDDFDGATREVSEFAPINPTKPSTLEHIFGKEIRFERARFVYLSGEFEEAKYLLDQELKAINYERREKLHDSLISYLAGVHCETGNPAEAIRLTEPVLADTKGHSRLHVSLAEACLHHGMTGCYFQPIPYMDETAREQFSTAKGICETVLQRYQSMRNFDTINGRDEIAKADRINYLRLTTIIARISFLEAIFDGGDLSDAFNSWVAVSNAIKHCQWTKRGFMEAISQLTMGAIEKCLAHAAKSDAKSDGHTAMSEFLVKDALGLLNREGRRHLIVGLGVIWPQFTENVRVMHGGRLATDLNAELL